MTKAYSIDLRKRVIKYIEKGNSYTSSGEVYEISRETARKWYIRWKEEGHCNQKPRPGKKGRILRREFENYLNSYPGSTLAQIGENFKMTARSAFYYMRKFGYSYKKKSPVTWKQRRKSEEVIETK